MILSMVRNIGQKYCQMNKKSKKILEELKEELNKPDDEFSQEKFNDLVEKFSEDYDNEDDVIFDIMKEFYKSALDKRNSTNENNKI